MSRMFVDVHMQVTEMAEQVADWNGRRRSGRPRRLVDIGGGGTTGFCARLDGTFGEFGARDRIVLC
jgi:hypothetical protein